MGTDASSLAQESTKGIIPRALTQILARPGSEENPITVSFQEIYIDSVKDLLDPKNFMLQNSHKYEPTQAKANSFDQVL